MPAGLHDCSRTVRQHVHQPAAAERLHDHDGDSPGSCGLQAVASRLRDLVVVVVLDLADVPVIVVQDLQETVRIAMEGEADVPDRAGSFLLLQPLGDAEDLQFLPHGHVRQMVHQVVINAVGLQPAELLTEILFRSGPASDKELRQLRCYVHAFPQSVSIQDGAEGSLAAGIDVGCVIVVHARGESFEDLFFRLGHIDAGTLPGKPHAAVAENGKFVANPVLSVLHSGPSFVSHHNASAPRQDACGIPRAPQQAPGSPHPLRTQSARHRIGGRLPDPASQ